MKDICDRFISKLGLNKNNIVLIYNGDTINNDLTFIEQANEYDKNSNEMNILVQDIAEINNSLTISKDVICPICKENCIISIVDYKINLYECKSGHKHNNIFLDEFNNTQLINESNIICSNCNISNKSQTHDRKFNKCLTCEQNLCPLCIRKHNKEHTCIDYDLRKYHCNKHNDNFFSYCKNCKKDLCMHCENEHENHQKIKFTLILPDINKIKKELEDLRNNIDKFEQEVNLIIEKLLIVKQKMETFYNINYTIFKNYEIKNRNYQVLQNLNKISQNIQQNNIEKIINDENIANKIIGIIDIYNKMTTKDENQASINSTEAKEKKEDPKIKNDIEKSNQTKKMKKDNNNENNFKKKFMKKNSLSSVKIKKENEEKEKEKKEADKRDNNNQMKRRKSINLEKQPAKMDIKGSVNVYHPKKRNTITNAKIEQDLKSEEKNAKKQLKVSCRNFEPKDKNKILEKGNKKKKEISYSKDKNTIEEKNENKVDIEKNNENEEYIEEKPNTITIEYKIDKKSNNLKLFGEKFVANNSYNCTIKYCDKILRLVESIELTDDLKKNDILKVDFIGIDMTNMSYMFYECTSLKSLCKQSTLDTSNVTDMSYMFYGCTSLSSLLCIDKWKTDNVSKFSYMFSRCISLSKIADISSWNTKNVKLMNNMFENCVSLSSVPFISSWDISNVINMSDMFCSCCSLSSLPDISKWDTSKVKDFNRMFKLCSNLKYIPNISEWDTSSLKFMFDMFKGCPSELVIPSKFKEKTSK